MPPRYLGRAERAAEYSPLSFLRDRREQLAEHAEATLATAAADGELRTAGTNAAWYWRLLRWDTEHFGRPMIRIDGSGWDDDLADPPDRLAGSLAELRAELASAYPRAYVFSKIPASEVMPLAVLGAGGFRLIETRLTYYTESPSGAVVEERFPVREATLDDVPHLRDVAARADNPFDRYHADPHFDLETARRYLATYAEESMRGFATAVLVPDDQEPAGAFLTLRLSEPDDCPLGLAHDCDLGLRLGRIPLVAVGPERRGWHLRLLSEATRYLAERGAEVVTMTTQAANGAVIRNCEKLGYRLGRVTQVLAAA